ncbi:hypothetical protein [Paenibacillus flagellatus]|uniref:Uncharacterized protein n=1 Tax=Paenibacillus flagellatus TaxID=2211139 RepID=A0A2V5KCJ9_9BACL|nr:hypothetical protein [Paenibacillus flagellatus]PYI51620.1 hypothetical protein DLM86_24750 [Paenibacillus flagellatus]
MKQILVFVLFAAMLCWAMFAPTYKHVVLFRQAMLQKEVDYMLEIGANASHGYVDEAAFEASRQRLARHGFETSRLEYAVSATSGEDASNPSSPILRGTGIELTIAYPYDGMLDIDRLIGIAPPGASSRISASGLKMSEYVP